MRKPGIDAIIHAPNRLQICAFLAPLEIAEFQVVRDALRVSDSVLSKHIKRLEDAGYVGLKRHKMNGRQRTWVHLTRNGRKALKSHVQELERLVSLANTIPEATRT